MGITFAAGKDFPRGATNLITELNTAGATAPEAGKAPYAAAADAVNGVVGITTSNGGGAWATNETVTITTPKYLELPGGTVTLTYN